MKGLADWRLTSTTTYCDVVMDKVCVIIYKNWSTVCAYHKTFGPFRQEKNKGIRALLGWLSILPEQRRIPVNCEGPERCPRIVEYLDKILNKVGVKPSRCLFNETIPSLFIEKCRRMPDKVAFMYKDKGIYKEVTWKEVYRKVEAFCLGLFELGLKRGDVVAIMGDNCVEWVYADLAVQCAGAISCGIYPTSSAPELKYLMKDTEATFFIAEDQEYVDKIFAVANELPQLRRVIVSDTRGTFMYNDPMLTSFAEVEELGKRQSDCSPQLFEGLITQVKPEELASIVYTSGTTGLPKGAAHTHMSLVGSIFSLVGDYNREFQTEQTTVAALTYSHLLGRCYMLYSCLGTNMIVVFPEEAETLSETLYEIQPTFLVTGPRMLQKYAAQALTGIVTSQRIKRLFYRVAMKIGRAYIRKKWEGAAVPLYLKLLRYFAKLVAFQGILELFGLKKTKLLLTGGAPLPQEVANLWHIWGINICETYGMTEILNICRQAYPFSKPGNSGQPFSDGEIRVKDDGELLARGPRRFAGYWKNDKATAELVDDGEWVHTGDVVEVSDTGEVTIVDRIKDIIITSGGKNISPSEIEKHLKSSPYISEAVVYGDGRKYLSALIEINFDTVSEWVREKGILYTSFESLACNPEVNKLIEGELAKGNKNLARVEQVKKFRILPKELDPEDEADPLTATRKIKRGKLYDKFKDLVESMYSKEEEELIRAQTEEKLTAI